MNDTSEYLLLALVLMFYECDTGGNDTEASDAMRALYEMLHEDAAQYFDDAHVQVHGFTLDQAGEPVPQPTTPQKYGCTYSTELHNFGEITSTFPVPDDWEGHRFHGYCWADARALEENPAPLTAEERSANYKKALAENHALDAEPGCWADDCAYCSETPCALRS